MKKLSMQRCNLHFSLSPTTGPEGKLEASVQPDHRAAVCPLPQAGQVQEAHVCALLLPFCTPGEEEVPHARLEHRLRVQRLGL